MCRSHPVRRLCEAPTAGETVTLVVGFDPETTDRDTLTAELSADATVVALPYDTLRVTVPQPAVADVCELDGVVRVETANVIDLGDAGEDV